MGSVIILLFFYILCFIVTQFQNGLKRILLHSFKMESISLTSLLNLLCFFVCVCVCVCDKCFRVQRRDEAGSLVQVFVYF